MFSRVNPITFQSRQWQAKPQQQKFLKKRQFNSSNDFKSTQDLSQNKNVKKEKSEEQEPNINKKSKLNQINQHFQQKITQQQNQSDNIHQNKQGQSKKQKKMRNKDSTNIEQLKSELQSSQFRMLNEMLYTTNSNESLKHFKNNKEDFQIYHQGYQQQISKWPIKPVEQIIKIIEKNEDNIFKNSVICDLGCGDGQIYEHFKQKSQILDLLEEQQVNKLKKENGFYVQSIKCFDLLSHKDFILQCDIAHLPLNSKSADAAIFCLSLMGTNYFEFIIEADRILKENGLLIIIEVSSRIANKLHFSQLIQVLGYKQKKIEDMNYFVLYILQKQHSQKKSNKITISTKLNSLKQDQLALISQILNGENQQFKKNNTIGDLSKYLLKPCLYKKR